MSFESPTLHPWTPGEPPAYEMKFLLDELVARNVELRLRTKLVSDPFGDPQLGNAYRVSTMYCDTAQLDAFHRVGAHRRRRYRLRRYGVEPHIYLERKTRRGLCVRKRRTAIDRGDLPLLGQELAAADWPGRWFHEQRCRRGLHPVCCLFYLRTALVGADDDGPLRVTFDRDICGLPADRWSFPSSDHAVPVLPAHVVCEFKFRRALPGLFKAILHDLQLAPTGVSKYRHCLHMLGIATNGSRRHA